MLKIIVLALVVGFCSAFPNPLGSGIPGALTTTHHHHTSAAAAHHLHHPVAYGMGYSMGGYPGVVKHTETVSSAAGYPASAAVLNPYSAYGAYPGLAGLGYGYSYPAAKQYTQVTTTAVRPSMYGYY